jgi:hypothetical protein
MDGQLYQLNTTHATWSAKDQPLRTVASRATAVVGVSIANRARRDHGDRDVLITALVIAAWKFGGTDDLKVQGVNVAPAATPSAVAKGVAVTATKGDVHGSAGEVGGRRAVYRGTLQRGQTKRFASAQALALRCITSQRGRSRRRVRVRVPASGQRTITPSS